MRDHCFNTIEYGELIGKKNEQFSNTGRANHLKAAKKEAQRGHHADSCVLKKAFQGGDPEIHIDVGECTSFHTNFHSLPTRAASVLPSRPGCLGVARSRQLRETPHCAALPDGPLPGYEGDALWC